MSNAGFILMMLVALLIGPCVAELGPADHRQQLVLVIALAGLWAWVFVTVLW